MIPIKALGLPGGLALTALVLLSSLASAEEASEREAQRSFMRQIAGSGGSVALYTGPFESGELGWFRMGMDPLTEQPVFHAEGRIDLRTTDLHLVTNRLEFDPQVNRLSARGQVELETDTFQARSESLVYRTDSGAVELDGRPFVRQSTATNTTTFEGMDTFVVQDTEEGIRLISLDGTGTITIEMIPLEGAEEAGEVEQEEPQGFAKLGSRMKLTVNPRGEITPRVRTQVSPEGELILFSASGSVLMNSEMFNLRCDEMNFYANRQRFEATGNVYLKKDGVEADAGRMVYDLETGRITLSVNPDVRSREEDGTILRLQNYDQVIVVPTQGGGIPDISGVGSGLITSQ